MKVFGEKKMVRLLPALLLVLTLLLSAAPASAQLITDWENVTVNIFWLDDMNNVQLEPAWPVPEDQVQRGYWVTLPPEALGKDIQLQIMYPDYRYFFQFDDLTLERRWLEEDNALSLSDEYAMYVCYSYDGVQQDELIRLYVSTLPYPFVEAEDMGPELLLPGSDMSVVQRPEVFLPAVTEPPVVEAIRPQVTEPPAVEVIRPQVTEPPVVEVLRPQVTEPPVVEVLRPQNATITVKYVDARTYEPIAPDQTVILQGDGSHTIQPDAAVVPAGYTPVAGTDMVTVAVRNGKATQDSVSFYFSKAQPTAAPVSLYNVTVYYYNTSNREIAPRETRQLAPGKHMIEVNPTAVTTGFELQSPPAFELTVYENGTYDRAPEDVGFWYRPAVTLPSTAKVSVRYLNENGQEIAPMHEVELAVGRSHRVSPDVTRIPTGYDAASEDAKQVTVSAEGHASPSVVTFVFGLRREEQNAPAGQRIDRYGMTNAKVRFRTEPYASSNKTIIREIPKGSAVYMVTNEHNDLNEMWTQVIIDNMAGYMQTQYIDMLTQEASDLHAHFVGATPVPTFTPAPTEVFVEFVTPVPVTPTPAASYAVANWGTGIRTGTGSTDYIMDWLEQDELVSISGQIYDAQTQNVWCYVRTLDGVSGYVQQNALRTVSQWEADWYREQWEKQHAAPAPTELITNTPAPAQWTGYAYAMMDNVYLRQMASENAQVLGLLKAGEVVHVASQQYINGAKWHYVNRNGQWGYIRSEFLWQMTDEQANEYFAQLYATPTPTPRPTTRPTVQNPMSGQGYVMGDQVNLRASASTGSKSLMSLNRYALCMVLDEVTVNGQKWYRVRFSRTEGYIHGNYFVEMTVAELDEFLSSDRYQQGLRNNDLLQGADDLGVQGPGGLVSGEDELLDDWYHSGSSPFVPPVGTPEPILTPTATPTRKPGTGYAGSYLPVETPVVTGGAGLGESSSELPLPGATGGLMTPPQGSMNSGSQTQSGGTQGGSPLVAILVIALLAAVGAGVIAVSRHQRKRKRMAMRAAQRRAQQARNAGGTGAMPNRIGAYFPQQTAGYGQAGLGQTAPMQPVTPASQNGRLPTYSAAPGQPSQNAVPPLQAVPLSQASQPSAVPQRPYARQSQAASGSQATGAQPRVGRRTAYQQALAAQQQNHENQTP